MKKGARPGFRREGTLWPQIISGQPCPYKKCASCGKRHWYQFESLGYISCIFYWYSIIFILYQNRWFYKPLEAFLKNFIFHFKVSLSTGISLILFPCALFVLPFKSRAAFLSPPPYQHLELSKNIQIGKEWIEKWFLYSICSEKSLLGEVPYIKLFFWFLIPCFICKILTIFWLFYCAFYTMPLKKRRGFRQLLSNKNDGSIKPQILFENSKFHI